MHTVKLLTNLVEHHQILTYGVIFLGLVFEGEVILIFTGVLASLGALHFWVALLFILAGGVTKTFLGYYFGKFLYNKYNHNKFFTYIERRVLRIMPRFNQRPFWSIFFSKFIMGVNYFVIIFSGFERIAIKTYLKAELISTAIWAPSLLCLGYFFSYMALNISKEISKFSLVIVLCVVGYILLDKFIGFLYWLFENLENLNSENNNHGK